MKPDRVERAITQVLDDTRKGSILGLALLVGFYVVLITLARFRYGYLLLQSTDNTE